MEGAERLPPRPTPTPAPDKGASCPSPSLSLAFPSTLRPPFGDFLFPPGAACGLLRNYVSPGLWAGSGSAEGSSPPTPSLGQPRARAFIFEPTRLAPSAFPPAAPPPPGRARAAPGGGWAHSRPGSPPPPETFLKHS